MGDDKHFGTLEVKGNFIFALSFIYISFLNHSHSLPLVFETKDIGINWIIGRVDETSRLSEVKKSHSSSHKFTDVFTL